MQEVAKYPLIPPGKSVVADSPSDFLAGQPTARQTLFDNIHRGISTWQTGSCSWWSRYRLIHRRGEHGFGRGRIQYYCVNTN
jgi:hypothetical protein